MFVIFDLDNCISNDGWRIPRIRWGTGNADQRYHEYHQLAAFDIPFHTHIVKQHLDEGHKPIFSTGRTITFRPITEEWIKRNLLLEPHEYILMMRNVGDRRKSPEMKRMHLRWLEGHFDIDVSQIAAAYDDRPEVIDMWRSEGIDGRHLFIHGEDAYNNPTTGEQETHERRADT